MEHEDLAVGDGPAPIPITGTWSAASSASATAAGTASKTMAKQPAACSARASSAICSRRFGGLALSLEAAERHWRSGASGRRGPSPGCPSRTIARARSTDGPPRSSLTASQPASRDEALGVLDRVLVGALVGAERHVADQKRRPQAAANRGGHASASRPCRPGSSRRSRARPSPRSRRPGRCRPPLPRRPAPRGSRRP